MRAEYRFTCPLRQGLHARPASMLAEVLRGFAARVTLAKVSGNSTPQAVGVDARSVLSVVGLDVKHEEACSLVASGSDAAAAVAAARELIETRLPSADDAPAPAPPSTFERAEGRLPAPLRRLGAASAAGRPVCGGIGIGAAVIVEGCSLSTEARRATPGSVDEEINAARRAVEGVRQDLCRRAPEARARAESDLLRAHAEIAGDPALWAEIERAVRAGATAAQAAAAAAQTFAGRLRTAESAYIQDRAADVLDVGAQLIDHLTGGSGSATAIVLSRGSVVFADALTANQLLRMERGHVRGLVLGAIGETAHTVILARTFGIPSLIHVPDPTALARAGGDAVVDGDGGFVVTPVTPEVARYYGREQRTQQRRRERLRRGAVGPAITRDGVRLDVGVNASSAAEAAAAVENGADGVGLFRTEFLFLERGSPPGGDEQLAVYSAVIDAAAGRPVIFRTFDIGGDKPAPYLAMPREENPFLGVRGVRLYERHVELLQTQLRAIVRASAGAPTGTAKIMAPMIAVPAEAEWFRGQVRDAEASLRGAGVAFDAATPVGVMIEVPSAAMAIDPLCAHADFFSIGTNDLCQYWMAADRGNRGVAGLCDPHQPSFLRLLRTAVAAARAGGRWIGVCGEMAGRLIDLPLMLGLGVDEISVAPGGAAAFKAAVARADAARCRAMLDAACGCGDPAGVERLLHELSRHARAPGVGAPVVDPELIEIGSDASTKEEAIKAAVDLLSIAGRTDRPREVEAAVWAREAAYSTGLGFGFAVPHCKTDAVAAPALVALKLTSPVEWGSMDGAPVAVVLLLVTPASDGGRDHMRVFATLSRRLMHEEFRHRLLSAGDAAAMYACLRQELGPALAGG